MKNTNKTLDKGEVQDKTAQAPNSLIHTLLLPVTVVAPKMDAEQTRLTDEMLEELDRLITRDLRLGGHSLASALSGARLYTPEEIANDLASDGPSAIWTLCG